MQLFTVPSSSPVQAGDGGMGPALEEREAQQLGVADLGKQQQVRSRPRAVLDGNRIGRPEPLGLERGARRLAQRSSTAV